MILGESPSSTQAVGRQSSNINDRSTVARIWKPDLAVDYRVLAIVGAMPARQSMKAGAMRFWLSTHPNAYLFGGPFLSESTHFCSPSAAC